MSAFLLIISVLFFIARGARIVYQTKYVPFLSLLLALSVGAPLHAQATKQATTKESLSSRVKKYQDWLNSQMYFSTKVEEDDGVWLIFRATVFKETGETFALMIDKKSAWVYLKSWLSLPADDKGSWRTRVYVANRTNHDYTAVQVSLSSYNSAEIHFRIWAIDPNPERLDTFIEVIKAAKGYYLEVYSATKKIEQSQAKKK